MSQRQCSLDECLRPHHARGYCRAHYQQFHYGKVSDRLNQRGQCSLDECLRPHHARGYCRRHYLRFYRHGDPAITLPAGAQPRKPVPLWITTVEQVMESRPCSRQRAYALLKREREEGRR